MPFFSVVISCPVVHKCGCGAVSVWCNDHRGPSHPSRYQSPQQPPGQQSLRVRAQTILMQGRRADGVSKLPVVCTFLCLCPVMDWHRVDLVRDMLQASHNPVQGKQYSE